MAAAAGARPGHRRGVLRRPAAIAAGRRLGSRLASFVALLEVLAALVFAWLLLGQLPDLLQLAGGVVVLAGVVLVKLGEPRVADEPVELPRVDN